MTRRTRHYFAISFRRKGDREWTPVCDNNGVEMHYSRLDDAEEYAVRLRAQRRDIETSVHEGATLDLSYLDPSRPTPRPRFWWW